MRIEITDASDPRIAVYLGLRDHVARQAAEQPGGEWAGSFIVEGDLVIDRAISAGQQMSSILIPAARTKPLPESLPVDAPVYAASGPVLEVITGRPQLRDPIASFVRQPIPAASRLLETARTVAVLENVNNPNNMGVIMRCAAGLGLDAVFLDPTCCDPLYRRAVRASMGEVFAIPYAWLDRFPAGLGVVTDRGFRVLAMTPAPDAIPLPAMGLTAGDRIAILLGAEGPGLSSETLAATPDHVRVPMAGNVDSLNVAAAAAISFYVAANR